MMYRTANRPARRTAVTVLDSERGAFDLPSIVTGVVVVGVLTAGVLTSVFGVIPFAQDKAAKQDTEAIRTAQGVARAKDGRYLDREGLVSAGYLPPARSSSATGPAENAGGFERVVSFGNFNYTVATNAEGTCYLALARSGTGTIFFGTEDLSAPQELTPATVLGCLPDHDLQSLVDSVGGYASKYIPTAPTAATGAATTGTTATFTWDAVAGATGYTVEKSVNGGAWSTVATNQPGTSIVIEAAKGDSVAARVSSVNGSVTSAPVPAGTVVLLAAPPAAPSPETYTSSHASFIWGAVPGATGYTVEKSVNGGTWTVVSTNQAATAAIISAAKGDGIAVRVSSVNAAGTSVPGPSGSVVLLPGSPNTPTGVAATETSASFTWGAVSGATGYKVEKSINSGSWSVVSVGQTAASVVIPAAKGDSVAVRVSSINAGGTSAPSPAGTVVLPAGANFASSISWSGRTVPTGRGGYDLAMSSDGVKLLMVRNDRSIYRSANGGTSWTELHPTAGIYDSMRTVASSADGTKIFAGFGTGIVRSTNSGTTWTKVGPHTNIRAIDASADGTKVVAAGDYGWIYTSTDSGATWTQRHQQSYWLDAAISDDGKTMAVVSDFHGGVFISRDSGATWYSYGYEWSLGWASIAISGDAKTMIGYRDGGIMTSADYGYTWTKRTTGSTKDFKSVAVSDDGLRMIASAEYDGIYSSVNGGVTWKKEGFGGSNWTVATTPDGGRYATTNWNATPGFYTGTYPY